MSSSHSLIFPKLPPSGPAPAPPGHVERVGRHGSELAPVELVVGDQAGLLQVLRLAPSAASANGRSKAHPSVADASTVVRSPARPTPTIATPGLARAEPPGTPLARAVELLELAIVNDLEVELQPTGPDANGLVSPLPALFHWFPIARHSHLALMRWLVEPGPRAD